MNVFYPPQWRAAECAPYLSRQRFGVRRQSAAATALSKEHNNICRGKSGVALRFPPQSKTPGGMPRAFQTQQFASIREISVKTFAFFAVNMAPKAAPRPLTRPAPVVTVYASFLRWNTKTH
jgi:hypothetical protein